MSKFWLADFIPVEYPASVGCKLPQKSLLTD